MKKTVLKFGGTSLDTPEKRNSVCNIIKDKLDKNVFPVVVVSAMGRIGQSYSTDSIRSLITTSSKDISDFAVSCGEMISAAVVASELIEGGITAKPLTGWQAGIITDMIAGEDVISFVNNKKINELLEAGIIPVVCGYQGISTTGDITTLSRGGTDISAIYICRAIGADKLEVYKDVKGIFSADPSKVEKVKLLETLSFDELAEITGNGSGVIHNQAVEYASLHDIAIGVGDTLSGDIGTLISSQKSKRLISALSSKSNLSLVSMEKHDNILMQEVFNTLSKANVSVDFISVNRNAVNFVVNEEIVDKLKKNMKNIAYKLEDGFSKISLCGNGMTGQPGVMARVTDSLIRNKIDIILATDSYSTISVLVKKELEIKVLNILHQEFILQEEIL